MKSLKRGFTLPEIIIALSILAILTSIVVVQMNEANNTAKDSKRRMDINLLKSAVVSYKTENYGAVPVQTTRCSIGGTCPTEVTTSLSPYLSTLPADPDSEAYYTYETNADGTDCAISAILSSGKIYRYSCSADSFSTNGITDAVCGTANKAYSVSDISFGADNFCNQGNANPSNPIYPFHGESVSWVCEGLNGGANANCTASRALDGLCGTANKTYAAADSSYGSDSICVNGTVNPINPSFPAQGSSTTWSCDGVNGGINVSCTASRIAVPVDGLCGAANKTYVSSASSYGSDSFCNQGTADPTSPAFPTQGQSVGWDCKGVNEGTNASCMAYRGLDGSCGAANKTYAALVSSYGSDNFCNQGTANPASPSFPDQGNSTTWSCDGANGGINASCTASRLLLINGSCGTANKTYDASVSSYGSDSFCNQGTANPTNPAFPAQGGSTTWSCDGANGGTNTSCTASRLLLTNGLCGTSNGGVFASAPTTNLCNAGSATSVTTAAGQHYSWSCNGLGGGTNASCVASGNLLVNDVHTEADCTNAAGTLVASDTAGKKQCKFTQSVNPGGSSGGWNFSCPGGWTAYKSYTQTVSTPSSWCKCDWPAECLYLGSACTTGSHGWSNSGQETCGYGCYFGPGCSGYVYYTCYSNISARGCY